MIYRARTVVPMHGPPIPGGAVAIEANRIAAVGPAHELGGEAVDLGEVILLPGLINIHCHLDYTMMRHAILPPTSFTEWVQRINALKRTLDDCDYLTAITGGFAEAKRWGTTTVGNIEAFPELMPQMPPSPLRTWWFYEMIDVRHRFTTELVVEGALSFFEGRGRALDRYGLSPHAPYTASAMLYALAGECATRHVMALTTHLAESREELLMFRDARGPLFEFLRAIGRPMSDCGAHPPFSALWLSGAIDARWILVHMNELDEEDFRLIESLPRGAGPHVVHCPRSHRYFGHTAFPYQRLQALGLNISVATDSLASTDSLSLLAELRALRRTQPWLSPEELLRTVTLHPARALGMAGQLGTIAPGALADLIAIPASGNFGDVFEEILSFTRPVPWMLLDGNVVT
jgi:cytosine/adenosine deaminase-related metal-dependent hydrolase